MWFLDWSEVYLANQYQGTRRGVDVCCRDIGDSLDRDCHGINNARGHD